MPQKISVIVSVILTRLRGTLPPNTIHIFLYEPSG